MSQNQLDAKMFKEMFLAGAKNLESKKEYINELNVVPVPDGDTGTNMSMTMENGAKEVSDKPAATVGEVGVNITSYFLKASENSFFTSVLTCCAFL